MYPDDRVHRVGTRPWGISAPSEGRVPSLAGVRRPKPAAEADGRYRGGSPAGARRTNRYDVAGDDGAGGGSRPRCSGSGGCRSRRGLSCVQPLETDASLAAWSS